MKASATVERVTVVCSGKTKAELLKDLRGAVDFIENDFEFTLTKPKKRKRAKKAKKEMAGLTSFHSPTKSAPANYKPQTKKQGD